MIRYDAESGACPDVVTMIAGDVERLNRRAHTWHRLQVHITGASVYRLADGTLTFCGWPRPAGEPSRVSRVDLYVAGQCLRVAQLCGTARQSAMRGLRGAFLREFLAYVQWGAPHNAWISNEARRKQLPPPTWYAVRDLVRQLEADAEQQRAAEAMRAELRSMHSTQGDTYVRPKWGWEL